MEELMKLKTILCDTLEEYSRKGKMGAGDLDVVDKLTHTIKNLDKIIENYDEYSGMMDGNYSNRRYSMARGRNARRDSRGRYSSRGEYRDGYSREYNNGYSGHDMVMELKEMMEDAPDERTRNEFEKFIRKMEMM